MRLFYAIISSLLLSLLSLLVGCGKADSEASSNVFVFARGADAQKLDPADIDDGESVNSLMHVLEGLLRFKPGSLEVEPWLAKSYEISEDGLVYTFHLREGIQFHDGTPLNAETARFSFDRQMDPSHPAHFPEASFQYWQNLFSAVERLETPDSMTLEFHLSETNAGILDAFAAFPAFLISPNAFERMGKEIAYHPVGTGPYEFVDWRPQEAIVYQANDNYWGEPKPGYDRLVIRSIPLNTTRLSSLIAGSVDGLDGLQPSELADLQADPRFKIYHAPGLNVGYMAFNDYSDRLRNPQIRKAISMAIDRKAIVELALNGYGKVANYPLPEGYLGHPGDEGPIRYDPEAAAKLLAEFPELKETPIRLATFGQPRVYFPDPQRVASLIKSDLEKVGLRVEIVNREFKSHLHQMRQAEHELTLLGWIADTPDPDGFLTTFFHSKSAIIGSALNISYYRNPEMDRLLEEGLRHVDPEKRVQIYNQVLELWERDLPLIPLVSGEQITVLKAEVGGYILHPGGNHYFGPIFPLPNTN